MRLSERIAAIVDALPEDGSVNLPVSSLKEWLAEETGEARRSTMEPLGDLTIEQVAAKVRRADSTIRGWLNGGLLPGAYKLRGRDWRVPAAVLSRFLQAQAGDLEHPARGRRTPVEMGAWRRHLKASPRGPQSHE